MIRWMKSMFSVFLFAAILFSGTKVLAGNLEITPFWGYGFGGGFENSISGKSIDLADNENFGVIAGWYDKNKPGSFYEFTYMRQPTQLKGDGGAFSGADHFDVDIDYYHLGGSYRFLDNFLNPFVSGGLGLTHMSPNRGNGETRFSLSIGGGVKIPVTDHLALRFEGRGFGTFFNGSGQVFCNDADCDVKIQGDLFWQFSTFAGVVLSF